MTADTSSYERLPYESHAFPQTRPEQLAFIGTLFGLSPALPSRARVLELGCAGGGNLLPLACLYPQASFVGIDQARAHIDEARRAADELQLTNIAFVCGDLADRIEGEEPFDYIVCHGVYSWVPEPVQDAILRIGRERLRDDGIAYVSYNTYPGWKSREIVRELMLYHARGIDDPATRIQQARAILQYVTRISGDAGAFGRQLDEVSGLVSAVDDYYLFHEYLEATNRPCWFKDFMQRADAHGLTYLGEAALPDMAPFRVGSDVHATLDALSGGDILATEQYQDFFRNRTFRQTLLVRKEAAARIDRRIGVQSLLRYRISGEFSRTNDEPLGTLSPAKFTSASGVVLTVQAPIQKAALVALGRTLPAARSFDEWVSAARVELTGHDDGNRQDVRLIGELLLELTLSGLVTLELEPLVSRSRGSPPAAFAPARRLAQLGRPVVPTMRHRSIRLDPARLAVLSLLDGERDEAAVVEALHRRLTSRELVAEQDGRQLYDSELLREVAGRLYREASAFALRQALLC